MESELDTALHDGENNYTSVEAGIKEAEVEILDRKT